MDWNWFFSSLAQSTAAIVGIFGAFIITKILSNQAVFDSKKKLVRELTSKSKNLQDEANDLSIDWYNKKIAEWRVERLNAALDKRSDLAPEDLYEELNFSIYQSKEDSISIIESAMDAHRLRKEAKAAAMRERARQMMERFYVEPQELTIPNITPHFEIESVKAERAKIDAVARNCKQHIRVVRDAFDSIVDNPEHSPQITYTLLLVLVLFYLGVIYPLSFTPAKVDTPISVSISSFLDIAFSIKGLLLTLVSVVFTIVIGMFFLMNIRMRYSTTELEKLKSYSTLGFYSPHFEIAETNKKSDRES